MITEATTLIELAAIVSGTLEREGIVATLSGGAAVSIYSDNRYVSEDLDFVMVPSLKNCGWPWNHSDSSTPARRGYPYLNIQRLAGTSNFRLHRWVLEVLTLIHRSARWWIPLCDSYE